MVDKIVGIDLGTTNSVIATIDLGGGRILDNKENEKSTRSVVGYFKGEFLVGRPAIQRWTQQPKDTIISIKRLMGRGVSDEEVEKIKKLKESKKSILFLYDIVEPSDGTKDSIRVILGGKEYSPVEISAKILTKLKEDAEYRLGEKVTYAVITVPAYFSDKQRQATREAGLKAGLTVMRIFDEPTAVAMAYGIDSKEKEAKTILVYDLGGGTFDVSVLMMAAKTFAPLNLDGDMWLGGDNFDQMIEDYVIDYVKKEYGIDPTENLRFMAKLKMEAQGVKETLSSARKADVIVSGILHDNSGNITDIEVEITREQFEEMIKPLVEKTVSIVKKAVEDANLTLDDIDYVLMAGNATCVPMVQQSIEELFGKKKVLRKIHPKDSVAIGAAILAAINPMINCPKCNYDNNLGTKECEKCGTLLKGAKICPTCGIENDIEAEKCKKCDCLFIKPPMGIAPFHYGVQTAGDKFNLFIDKGDPFPTPEDKRVVQTFFTRFPNQRVICVPVYGGKNLERASKNTKQAEAIAILPPNCLGETRVKVKVWLDKNGEAQIDTFFEDGTDLKDLILRGETDQKAIDIFVEAEKLLSDKRDLLSPNEIEKIEKKRKKFLEEMEGKNFKKAVKEAEDLLKLIKESGKEPDSLKVIAEGMVNYVTYLVNQYGWLIGQSVYNLNKLKESLQEAIDKNDRDFMESKTKELESETGKLMETVDSSGKKIPTLLGTFISWHMAIIANVNPVNPVVANNFRDELNEIEKEFKDNKPSVLEHFKAFANKVNKFIEDNPPPPLGNKCDNCGFDNPPGIRTCKKCGEDLWILKVKQAGPSTGDLFKT
jgi:molecular chaperone DnaK (HSP70)